MSAPGKLRVLAKFTKIRRRDITIVIWNTSTVRGAGKLQELTHKMDRYRWNIFGNCEMRWKNFGETATEERHKVFFSGKENKHEHGVGFLVKQGHREHCHGMSPSLQQAHLPPERSAFHHAPGQMC